VSDGPSHLFDRERWLRLSPLLDQCLALEGDDRARSIQRVASVVEIHYDLEMHEEGDTTMPWVVPGS
jgi:hypothetical protein